MHTDTCANTHTHIYIHIFANQWKNQVLFFSFHTRHNKLCTSKKKRKNNHNYGDTLQTLPLWCQNGELVYSAIFCSCFQSLEIFYILNKERTIKCNNRNLLNRNNPCSKIQEHQVSTKMKLKYNCQVLFLS